MLLSTLLALALYSEASIPNETRDDFVKRIAPRAVAYTAQTGWEVCGAIREADGVYTVDVRTSKRNDECELPGDTLVYLHTHPRNQGLGFSAGDYVRPGYLLTEVAIKYQDGVSKRPRKIR